MLVFCGGLVPADFCAGTHLCWSCVMDQHLHVLCIGPVISYGSGQVNAGLCSDQSLRVWARVTALLIAGPQPGYSIPTPTRLHTHS